MGRVYYLPFENQTYTAAGGDRDLWEVTPPDDKPLKILGIILANVDDTIVGDAKEENIRLAIIRGHTTSGNGTAYTTSTIAKKNPGDPNASFTAEHNGTTIASAGTPVTVLADGWNIRIPYQLWFPPEIAPVVTQSETTLVVRALTTVNADLEISGTLVVEEGG
jgi:hypothetical protein